MRFQEPRLYPAAETGFLATSLPLKSYPKNAEVLCTNEEILASIFTSVDENTMLSGETEARESNISTEDWT